MTLHFAALLCDRNCVEITILICDQKPCLVGFLCQGKGYLVQLYSVNVA